MAAANSAAGAREKMTRESDPGLGGEKQLFMAMRDAGGSITPIEAALETSLTVDEAEGILSRLAGRGHLLLESRDGVLFSPRAAGVPITSRPLARQPAAVHG